MHVRSSPRDKSLSQGQQLSKLVALLILSLQRTIFLVVTKSRSMSQRLPIRLLHFIWIVMGRTKRKYFLDELFSFLLLLSCLLVLCCFLLSQWKIALWNSVLLTSEDTGDVNFSFFSLKPANWLVTYPEETRMIHQLLGFSVVYLIHRPFRHT